jgi:hypothetical protein
MFLLTLLTSQHRHTRTFVEQVVLCFPSIHTLVLPLSPISSLNTQNVFPSSLFITNTLINLLRYEAADVLIVKDVLQHLPISDIHWILDQVNHLYIMIR